ncbi:slr1306 family protein [Picosynechococcus sp. PCC 73109]|uniref:slr1306 family protein n=1 Tax=Picosynechococcus sp. PCC 73109 TaxID=374982 RepID=UPI0007458755|nr:DUF697 domain-containing protein [Picosynechococcus sp. PCC 73109]AMA09986.1 hypothetical protein AWQ23_12030 [Picosynechococcus sp. PCC 73109]
MQKPILVGGLGLALFFAVLGRWQGNIFDLGEWLFWGAIAWGGLLLWQKKQPQHPQDNPQNPLKRKDVDQAIANAQQWVMALQQEVPDQDFTTLRQTLDKLNQEFQRDHFTVAIAGGRGTGKTTLLRQLQATAPTYTLQETPPLFTDLASYDQAAQNQVFAADLVIFLVNGDLMASQWQTLNHWHQARQTILIAFNKQDQYQPEQRELILNQLRNHCQPAIAPQNILPITAAPQAIKVKKIQADGTATEHFERPDPVVAPLQHQLQTLLSQPETQQQLLWSTIWRTARLTQHNAKQTLNQFRRERALPILEKYQWLAAGATFANPVAALDLLATAAVTGQMIMDVGAVYQQRLSLGQAQAIATTLGKQMIQLGLVELSTQAVGGMLKTNAITYLAGGAVQGVSAAYLTHIAGLSLIQYFQEQNPQTASESLNFEKLGQILKRVFEQNQRSQFFGNFVKGTLNRLSPQTIS